jgi:hypothetical protein
MSAETGPKVAVAYLPFGGDTIVCDGHLVPYIKAHPSKERVSFVLDGRFGIDVPPSLADQFVAFVANAMAVAAGYSCHGENSVPANPFKTKLMGITINSDENDE